MALDQHFQDKMTSSMQSFRHFWLNVQGIALADVAPKLRQMTSIRKKQRKHNEMGYLRHALRFDLRSTVLALGVKMYWGQTSYFSNLTFFYNNFRTNCLTATYFTSWRFSRWDESSDTQFCPKKSISKFDLPPNFGSQVRAGQNWPYLVSFDSWPQSKQFVARSICLSPLVQKLWAE